LLKDVPVDILSTNDDFPEHMQRASGFYDPQNKQIKIAETVASYPGGDPISINVTKTVSHELGHAYDDATGAGTSLDANDVADAVRRTRGTTATERINARYFTSSSKEIFAELYALAHSPEKAEKYFGIPRARAERIWAKPLAQLRAMGAKRFVANAKAAEGLMRNGWVIEDDGSVYAVINGSIYDVDAAGTSLTKLPAGEYSDEQLQAALAKL
jgi:hypothetical protein